MSREISETRPWYNIECAKLVNKGVENAGFKLWLRKRWHYFANILKPRYTVMSLAKPLLELEGSPSRRIINIHSIEECVEIKTLSIFGIV